VPRDDTIIRSKCPMNIGKIDMSVPGFDKRHANKTILREADLSRLALLLLMVLFTCFGLWITRNDDNPSVIIKRAVKKTLKQSFRASLEGSIAMNNETLASYRSRYRYKTTSGLTVSSQTGDDQPPFDPLTALNFVQLSKKPVLNGLQDMYEKGTVYLSGSVKDPAGNESVSYVFNCWVDMDTSVMVRLDIAGVKRNAGVNKEGKPVSQETYVNIWYFDHGK
jgi:hypothetical protein